MNKLIQLPSFLIGSESDLISLENAKEARFLVMSDSHGDVQLVKKIVLDFGEKCDVLIFCGDGISNLMSVLCEAQTDETLMKSLPKIVAFVQGNNDSSYYARKFCTSNEVDTSENDGRFECKHINAEFCGDDIYDNFVSEKNSCDEIMIPKSICFTACFHKVLVVHGHADGVYYSTLSLEEKARSLKADLVFYGHTHVAKEECKMPFLVNPGSISLPRCSTPASFAVVNLKKGKGNVETAFFKILKKNNSITYGVFTPIDFGF